MSRGLLRTDAARIESIRVTSEGKPVPTRDLAGLRDAMAGLFAGRVLSFERPAGVPNLVLEVAVTEGGSRRRITCRSSSPAERLCALDGVNATLEVPEAKLTPFLGAPVDAGKTP